jgi:hypothetical protein
MVCIAVGGGGRPRFSRAAAYNPRAGNKVGGAAGFCAIMGALERNRAVEGLWLDSSARIGVEGARAVQRALERNSTLTSLNIPGGSARCYESGCCGMRACHCACLLTRFDLQGMLLGRRVHAPYRVRWNATPRSPV